MSTVSSLSKKNIDSFGNTKASSSHSDPLGKVEGRALPSNLDAEQGILAACIVDASGEVISNCIEKSLRPEDFYFTKHQLIFDALLDLYNDTVEPDEIVL